MLFLLLAKSVEGHTGTHRSEACCPLDDDLNTTSTRRLLHELEEEVDVERWRNEPAGKRQRERLCKCSEKDPRDTVFDQVMTYMIVVIVVTFVAYIVWRSHASRRALRRMNMARENELASHKSKLQTIIDDAKELLSPLDEDDSTTCPVCLEPLKKTGVHPPNCSHAFHRHCIEQWLDTATIESAKGVDLTALRALGCPTCCRPLYDLNLLEEDSVDLESPATTTTTQQDDDEDRSSEGVQDHPDGSEVEQQV